MRQCRYLDQNHKPGKKQWCMVQAAQSVRPMFNSSNHMVYSVTAVCRMEQAALMRSLGAEKIIDYTKQDFTKTMNDMI